MPSPGNKPFSTVLAPPQPQFPSPPKLILPRDAAHYYHPIFSVARYSRALRVLHAAQALAVVGALGSVNYAIRQPITTPEGKKNRTDAMFAHKSFGAFVFATLPFRVWARVQPNAAPPIPGQAWKALSAQLVHGGLYGGLAFMASTGLLMTYYTGSGLPVFFTTWKEFRAEVKQPDQAKFFYTIHKQFGYYWQVLVPMHVGGAFLSYSQGLRTFSRMNPFVY